MVFELFRCREGDLANTVASHAKIDGENSRSEGSTTAILCARGYANTQEMAMTGDDDDDDMVLSGEKRV